MTCATQALLIGTPSRGRRGAPRTRWGWSISRTVKVAYDNAMDRVRSQRQLPLVVADRPVVPDRIEWLRSEMLKTRVAHGYCSRHLAAEACAYANICEQCDNYTTTSEFGPQLQAQLTDATALREDAEARGWDSEVARHVHGYRNFDNYRLRMLLAASGTRTRRTALPR